MEIVFRTRKLAKAFNSASALRRAYGDRMAQAIMNRLAVLENARTLALVPRSKPERCHLLKSDRKGRYAVDLVHPYRLVFEPACEPVPRDADGGIDTGQVTAITIVEIVDYH